jgi:hypothetical protein
MARHLTRTGNCLQTRQVTFDECRTKESDLPGAQSSESTSLLVRFRWTHSAVCWPVLSGMADLNYQVVRQKIFSYLLGGALLSATIVVAAYMPGLAPGWFFAGLLCNRFNPRKNRILYGPIGAATAVRHCRSSPWGSMLLAGKTLRSALAGLFPSPRSRPSTYRGLPEPDRRDERGRAHLWAGAPAPWTPTKSGLPDVKASSQDAFVTLSSVRALNRPALLEIEEGALEEAKT